MTKLTAPGSNRQAPFESTTIHKRDHQVSVRMSHRTLYELHANLRSSELAWAQRADDPHNEYRAEAGHIRDEVNAMRLQLADLYKRATGREP